jgi:hypothetical protein
MLTSRAIWQRVLQWNKQLTMRETSRRLPGIKPVRGMNLRDGEYKISKQETVPWHGNLPKEVIHETVC